MKSLYPMTHKSEKIIKKSQKNKKSRHMTPRRRKL